MSITVRHAHLSMKYSARADAVGRYIAACVREHDLDLVTTTECRGKAPAVRKALGPGWWVRAGGEHLICGRWARIAPAKRTKTVERRLTHVYSGHSAWRDTRVATQMCRVLDDTGRLVRRMLVSSAHLPSGVERPGGMKANSQTRTHRLATPRWGRSLARRARKVTARLVDAAARGPKAVTRAALRVLRAAGMDTNLDQHDKQDRDYMRAGMRMPGIWDRDRPAGGTHGRRLIDTIHSSARIESSGLVRVDPGDFDARIDHDGVWCVLAVGKGKSRGDVSIGPIGGDR